MTADLSSILSGGWGPTEADLPSFSGLPFTPFSKRDSINYVANWDESDQRRRRKNNRSKFGDDEATSNQLGVFSGDEENDTFEDGITVVKKKYETIAKYRRDRTGQIRQMNYSQSKKVIAEQQRLQNAPASRRGTRRQVQNKRRRRRYVENPRPMTPSIKKVDSWVDCTDIWFRETFEPNFGNTKTFNFKIDGENEVGSVYTPRSKKLILAGVLHGVLTKFDCLNGNTYKPEMLDYERFSNYRFVHFNHKSAIEDPKILELCKKPSTDANIYTTDNVLSAIMCCNRSKYSFDIVIDKVGDTMFLNERSKTLSPYSVDECSQYRPTKKGTAKNNQVESLAQEATYINHVFREQMVFHSRLEYQQQFKTRHPFENEVNGSKGSKNKRRRGKKQQNNGGNNQQQCASQAFSYNKFDVTDNIRVLCRCAIDGHLIGGAGKKKDWVKIFALNQYDCNASKTVNWTKSFGTKMSTIMSQEVGNNNYKIARWAMMAHLSDAKYIKLGFVNRSNVYSIDRHMIVGVKTFGTDEFIKNTLRIKNMNEPWTVFAKFIKCVQELKDDGRYIAIRDPLKQVIRIYKTSDDAFVKEDGLPSFGQFKKMVSANQGTENGAE